MSERVVDALELEKYPIPKPYRLVGHAICLGEKNWPPMLQDSACPKETLQFVVDALNFMALHRCAKESAQ